MTVASNDGHSEAPQHNAQPLSRGTAQHGSCAGGSPIPIGDQGGAVCGHSGIAERPSRRTIQPPLRREDAQGKPALMRIARGQRIRASGTAAADDFHRGETIDQQPVEIGSQARIIGKGTRTRDDETEHGKHLQNEQRRGNPPQGGAAPALTVIRHRGARLVKGGACAARLDP